MRRHLEVRSAATLYDPAYEDDFAERRNLQRSARQRDCYRWQGRKQLELAWVS